jgi:hypothetical protein
MYETQLEIPALAEAATGDALAVIAWPNLVASLAARRDLRRVLLAREPGCGASFNPMAAAMLAELAGGKRDVNRDALADGKYPSAKVAGAAGTAASGDREN